jgi:hypothetical protein
MGEGNELLPLQIAKKLRMELKSVEAVVGQLIEMADLKVVCSAIYDGWGFFPHRQVRRLISFFAFHQEIRLSGEQAYDLLDVTREMYRGMCARGESMDEEFPEFRKLFEIIADSQEVDWMQRACNIHGFGHLPPELRARFPERPTRS